MKHSFGHFKHFITELNYLDNIPAVPLTEESKKNNHISQRFGAGMDNFLWRHVFSFTSIDMPLLSPFRRFMYYVFFLQFLQWNSKKFDYFLLPRV